MIMKNHLASWLVASTLALGALPACGGASQGSGGSGTGGGTGSTGDQEPPDMMGMTAAHNAARAAVMPAANPALPPMVWSSTIATWTQQYTTNCNFADTTGPNGDWGSNAFAGTGTYKPADVVGSWVSEDADYDYATNTCTKDCGHYTQVVWRDSVGLGCGTTTCTQNNPFGGSGAWQLWVCNYDPAGNYVGMKPY
jgi:pathogenesis-related protein 1